MPHRETQREVQRSPFIHAIASRTIPSRTIPSNTLHAPQVAPNLTGQQQVYLSVMGPPLFISLPFELYEGLSICFDLMRHPASMIFKGKIYSSEMGITCILNLRIIKAKLNTGFYENIDQFHAQMRMMIRNARMVFKQTPAINQFENAYATTCHSLNEATVWRVCGVVESLRGKLSPQMQEIRYYETEKQGFKGRLRRRIEHLVLADQIRRLPFNLQRKVGQIIKRIEGVPDVFRFSVEALSNETTIEIRRLLSTNMIERPTTDREESSFQESLERSI